MGRSGKERERIWRRRRRTLCKSFLADLVSSDVLSADSSLSDVTPPPAPSDVILLPRT